MRHFGQFREAAFRSRDAGEQRPFPDIRMQNNLRENSMPLYFFDTYDQGELSRDEQGIECSSKSQVQTNALDALPDMAREVLPDGPNHCFRVEVRSEQGRVVFRARLDLNSEWLEDARDNEVNAVPRAN